MKQISQDEETLNELTKNEHQPAELHEKSMNIADIDETGNPICDPDEISRLLQIVCEIYQNSPVTDYQMGPPRLYQPYEPLDQATNADNYTGNFIEAWNIATSNNTVPLSEITSTTFLDADGTWLPPPSDMSKNYIKGKIRLIWDPTQPWGKTRRTPLLLSNLLTEAQNTRATNIFLHLPADFEWSNIPQEVGGRKISFYTATFLAKVMALAKDSERPHPTNYPYPPAFLEHSYIIDCNKNVHTNRKLWANKHGLPATFWHHNTTAFLHPNDELEIARSACQKAPTTANAAHDLIQISTLDPPTSTGHL